jgi:hypothetical protein
MKENHGSHNRLFTDLQELEIARQIRAEYIDRAVLFTCQTFRQVALEKWTALGRDPAQFACSDRFICSFKERNRFSSRKCHVKRRDPVGDEQRVEEWIQNMKELIAQYAQIDALDLIVNSDETAWRTFPSGMLTWAPVGADGVAVRLKGNEKECDGEGHEAAAHCDCERKDSTSRDKSAGIGPGAG